MTDLDTYSDEQSPVSSALQSTLPPRGISVSSDGEPMLEIKKNSSFSRHRDVPSSVGEVNKS